MPDASLPAVAEVAAAAARAGGDVLRESYGRVQSVRFKGATDLVTEVDVRAEQTIVALLRSHFPTHQILAEEGSVGGDDPRHRWIVDPLDGTTNYAHGLRMFSRLGGVRAGRQARGGGRLRSEHGRDVPGHGRRRRHPERPADRRLHHRHPDPSAAGDRLPVRPRPASRSRCGSSRRSACRPRPYDGSARRRWTAAGWRPAGSTATGRTSSTPGTSRPGR